MPANARQDLIRRLKVKVCALVEILHIICGLSSGS